MRKFSCLSTLAIGLLAITGARAQVLTTVSFDSGNQLLYSNAAKTTPLSAGAATLANDGAVLRLGYYTQGTNASPFSGTFVTLAGSGTLNTAYPIITIGDSPADTSGTPGTFALTLSFNANSPTSNNNLPAAGVPLVIQFYNNTTIATSTFFNAVSNALWDFKSPATPASTVGITLDDANLQWLGGAATAFYTSQAVPEPSTYVLALGGLGALVLVVRRRLPVA